MLLWNVFGHSDNAIFYEAYASLIVSEVILSPSTIDNLFSLVLKFK